MKLFHTFLLSILTICAFSQDSTTCVLKVSNSSDINLLEQQILNQGQSNQVITSDCQTIRVVVHVIYDGFYAAGNSRAEITPEQIYSQIRITNQFLRNDSLMYDSQNNTLGYTIELANTDPSGNPTTGITYTDGYAIWGENWHTYGLRNSNVNATVSASTIANSIGWFTDHSGNKYLNCYIVPKIDGNNGGGIQAFAFTPTSSVVYGNYNLANTFGAYQLRGDYNQTFNLKSYTNLGFTFTHEFYHNLAIYHTFNNTDQCDISEINCLIQGDRVCDTQPQTKATNCSGACGFLSYNVMDYISQTCKNRITQGQSDRAKSVLNSILMNGYVVCRPCPENNGDFDGNGIVDIFDISAMSGHYGTSIGNPNYNALYDMNCDGVINIFDVTMIDYGISTDVNEIESARGEVYDMMGRRVKYMEKNRMYVVRFGGITQKQLFN